MNTNCLVGLRCPQCKNENRLMIEGTSMFEVLDDGTESHGDVEWDDDSSAQCPVCHLTAGLALFRISEEEKNSKKTYEAIAYVTKRYTLRLQAISSDEAHKKAISLFDADGIDVEDTWQVDYEFHTGHVVNDPEEVKDV